MAAAHIVDLPAVRLLGEVAKKVARLLMNCAEETSDLYVKSWYTQNGANRHAEQSRTQKVEATEDLVGRIITQRDCATGAALATGSV